MEAKNIIYSKANIDNNFPGKNLFMKNKLKLFFNFAWTFTIYIQLIFVCKQSHDLAMSEFQDFLILVTGKGGNCQRVMELLVANKKDGMPSDSLKI